MNDLHDSIRDALTADAERAPDAAVEWGGPSALTDTPSPARPAAWLALASAAVLVVAGVWVITRRDTDRTRRPAGTTVVGGLDFSGVHRAEMEAEFPPDPGAPMYESAMLGSRSSAFDLESKSQSQMIACMNAVGFEFPLPPLTRAAIQSDMSQIIRPLTHTSAVKYGYAGAPDTTHASGKSADDYRLTLSTTKRQLFDAAAQNCLSKSRAEVFTDFTQYEARRQVMEEQRNKFIDAFTTSAPVRALDATWSSCMITKGYAVANIRAAMELGGPAQGTNTVAVADADCRLATSYEASYIELYRNAESAFVFDHRTQIIQLLQMRYGKLLQSEGKPPITAGGVAPTDTVPGIVPSTTAPPVDACFTTYTVEAGKTPAQVAGLFDTDLATLTAANKDNPSFRSWRVGDVIFIPLVHTCGGPTP